MTTSGGLFCFAPRGLLVFYITPYSETEDLDFDGELEGLTLPWSPDRLDLIKEGKADPNEEELTQWRRALCRKLAAGSDWCKVAWILPLKVKGRVAAHALFVCEQDADVDPHLEGVFHSVEEAKAALMIEGEMVEGE